MYDPGTESASMILLPLVYAFIYLAMSGEKGCSSGLAPALHAEGPGSLVSPGKEKKTLSLESHC